MTMCACPFQRKFWCRKSTEAAISVGMQMDWRTAIEVSGMIGVKRET
jgi:hypothetical protein